MQHDPIQRDAHLDAEYGFQTWGEPMLREHFEQFIQPGGQLGWQAIHARDHRTAWDFAHAAPEHEHDHTADELCLCPDHDTRPPRQWIEAELGPELPPGELLARGSDAEQAFDRLNPDFGALADNRDPTGHRVVQEREAGLALGTRVAVAVSRENDPSPILEVAGQDYRVADAAREARSWPTPAASWAASARAWAAVPEAEHDWGWAR
jgi:hypothetical protein